MINHQNDDRLIIPAESITTIIDKGFKFSGVIESDSGKSIMIAGEFEGTLITNGCVIISQSGVFAGSLTANKIRLAGRITKGKTPSTVLARESLIIESTGRLEADEMSYGGLDTQFGAQIRANVVPLTVSESIVSPPVADGLPKVEVDEGKFEIDNVTQLHVARVAAAG